MVSTVLNGSPCACTNTGTTAGAAALEVPSDVNFVPHLHIHSYAGVFFLKRAILFDLAVEGHNHAYLVPASTQRVRQRIHHIDQRACALQRRSLGADHENFHSMFNVTKLNRRSRRFSPL